MTSQCDPPKHIVVSLQQSPDIADAYSRMALAYLAFAMQADHVNVQTTLCWSRSIFRTYVFGDSSSTKTSRCLPYCAALPMTV